MTPVSELEASQQLVNTVNNTVVLITEGPNHKPPGSLSEDKLNLSR